MSRASNSLRTSDVITTPIKLKYTSSYDCNAFADYGIRVLDGVNGPVTVTGSVAQATLNYLSIRNLYYSNYLTGSIQQVTSSADNSLQSTAAIGTNDADIRYFPTESNATIKILSIPTNVFGQQLSRQGFALSSSLYYVVDDGNGNLIDRASANIRVGNIIYSQGMAIITNSNYQSILPVNPYVTDNIFTCYASDTPKTFNILSRAVAGTGTIDPTTVVLFDKDAIQFTNNLNDTVTLNTTNVGLFQTSYTVESIIAGSCNSPSNKGNVAIRVLPIPTFDTTTTTTTTTSTTTTTTTAAPTTTSTTTTTTTAAPTTTTSTTTTTTTAAPTTTTSTTTTTTTAAPTTTSTTTTTTTAPATTSTTTTTTTTPGSLYRYSSAGFVDACSTGLTMTNVVLIGGTFCDATAIQCDEFLLSPAGVEVWVRSGTSYRAATINDPNPSGIATFTAGCVTCPTPTTTTTTTSTTTTTTTAAPVTRNVTGVGGSASDILGEIYINASVSLDGNVSVETVFDVNVTTVPYGTVSVSVTVLSGSSSGSGSTFVGMGSLPSSISGECITACDNVNVVLTGFTC